MGEKLKGPEDMEAFYRKRRERRAAQERAFEIEQGLYIEPCEEVPEGFGAAKIEQLGEGLERDSREQVIEALQEIGNMMHALAHDTRPASARYEADHERYVGYIGSRTAGARLIINTESGPHVKQLIFPSANMSHASLKEAFEKTFGDLAQNIGTEERPYYLVTLT